MTRRAPLKRRADEITFPRQVSRTEKITSEVKSQVRGGDGGHPSATTDERCGKTELFFLGKKKKKKKKPAQQQSNKNRSDVGDPRSGMMSGRTCVLAASGSGMLVDGAASRCAREREHWMWRRRGRGGVGRRRRREEEEGGGVHHGVKALSALCRTDSSAA